MMTVRRARHDDIKGIIDYMEEYHKDSNLSDVPFDRRSTFQIVEYCVEHKDMLPLVAYADDRIIGVLFGSLEPYFFNQKKFYGTDIFFFSRGAGPQLWRKFKEWAFECGADRIIVGVSSGDARACQLLEALGMTSTGGMYVMRAEP